MPVALREALEAGGHRVTGPREAVWEVVSSADEHLTAEEVAERVRRVDPEVNLSSVYRSLALFAELGLVRESAIESGGPAHWELAHSDDHFHLRCTSCGLIEHHGGDMVANIRSHLGSDHGFKVERVDLVVTGLCRGCR